LQNWPSHFNPHFLVSIPHSGKFGPWFSQLDPLTFAGLLPGYGGFPPKIKVGDLFLVAGTDCPHPAFF